MNNIKKYTQKDRYGNMMSFEFDVPPMNEVPQHPGQPVGTDTVPAWLTPGEFVMNAEATRMFKPQIEAMNNKGQAVQAQQGGTIPQYVAGGGCVKPLYKAPGGQVPPMQYGGEIPLAAIEALARLNKKEYDAVRARQLMDQRLKGAPLIDIIGMTGNPSTMGNQPMSQGEIAAVNQKEMMDDYLSTATPQDIRTMTGNPVPPRMSVGEATAVNNRNLMDDYLSTATPSDVEAMTGSPVMTEEQRAVRERQRMDEYLKTATPDDIQTMTGTPAVLGGRGNVWRRDEVPPVTNTPPVPATGKKPLVKKNGTAKGKPAVIDAKTQKPIMQNGKEVEANVNEELTAFTDSLLNPNTPPKDPDVNYAPWKSKEAREAYLKGQEEIKKDPSAWGRIKQYFSGAAKDPLGFFGKVLDDSATAMLDSGVIDSGLLAKSAVLYLGSRALGYNHGDSIRWSGKQYVGTLAARDKAAAEAKAKQQESLLKMREEEYTQNRLDARETMKETGRNTRFDAEQSLKAQIANANLGMDAQRVGLDRDKLNQKIYDDIVKNATDIYGDGTYMTWPQAYQQAMSASPYFEQLTRGGGTVTAPTVGTGGTPPTTVDGTGTATGGAPTKSVKTSTGEAVVSTPAQASAEGETFEIGQKVASPQQFNRAARAFGATNIGNRTETHVLTKAYHMPDGRVLQPMTQINGYVGSMGFIGRTNKNELIVIPTGASESKDDKRHSRESLQNHLQSQWDKAIEDFGIRTTVTTTDGDTRTANTLSGNKVNYNSLKIAAMSNAKKLFNGNEEAALYYLTSAEGQAMMENYVKAATEYVGKYNKPITNFPGFIAATNLRLMDMNTGNIRLPALPKDPNDPVFADLELAIKGFNDRVALAGGQKYNNSSVPIMQGLSVLDGTTSELEDWQVELRNQYMKEIKGKSAEEIAKINARYLIKHINKL